MFVFVGKELHVRSDTQRNVSGAAVAMQGQQVVVMRKALAGIFVRCMCNVTDVRKGKSTYSIGKVTVDDAERFGQICSAPRSERGKSERVTRRVWT